MTPYPVVSSIWNAAPPADARRLSDDAEADVAVVGGGFAGLATALRVKDAFPETKVALLEAKYVGFGASGRCLGVLAPMHPGIMFGTLARCHGTHVAAWTARYLEAQVREWKELVAAAGISCDYRDCPVHLVASSRAEQRLLERCARNLEAAGVEHRFVEAQELRAVTAFPGHRALRLTTGMASVHPYLLARGLRTLALSRGVEVHEDSPVTRVDPGGDAVELHVSGGVRLRARRVVLATSTYTSQLGMRRESDLGGAYTYLLATEPLDGSTLARLGPAVTEGVVAEARVKYSYTRVVGRRLLFGGGVRMCRNTNDAAERDQGRYEAVERTMRQRFPFLDGAAVEAACAGPVHVANLARMPVVKASARHPNVILNVGYNVDGMSLSLISGKAAAGLLDPRRYQDPDAERLRKVYLRTRMQLAEFLELAPWLVRS